jgi:hypothetical protein
MLDPGVFRAEVTMDDYVVEWCNGRQMNCFEGGRFKDSWESSVREKLFM